MSPRRRDLTQSALFVCDVDVDAASADGSDSAHHHNHHSQRDSRRPLLQWARSMPAARFYRTAYELYYGKGTLCIVLRHAAAILRIVVVVSLVVVLASCVNYNVLRSMTTSTRLADVVLAGCPCVSRWSCTLLCAVSLALVLYSIRVSVHAAELGRFERFYDVVLGIDTTDLQTIEWAEVMLRLERLALFGSASSLVSITSLITRDDNLRIVLFGSPDVVDLRLPISHRAFLPLSLQWAIEHCVVGTLLDTSHMHNEIPLFSSSLPTSMTPHSSPRIRVLAPSDLAKNLRRHYRTVGVIWAMAAPLLALFMAAYFALRYGNEYYQNPSALGSRRFSQLACWRFREYNEVQHLFERRTSAAHKPLARYLAQYPSAILDIAARSLSFALGAGTVVLLTLSLIYPEALVHLRLPPSDSATPVLYLAVLGGVLAALRAMRPPLLAAPGHALLAERIAAHTHWVPPGPPHSARVHAEWLALCPLHLRLWVDEILGTLLLGPLFLCFWLPADAEKLVRRLSLALAHHEEIDGEKDAPCDTVADACFDNLVSMEPMRFPAMAAADESSQRLVRSMHYFKAENPAWQPNAAAACRMQTSPLSPGLQSTTNGTRSNSSSTYQSCSPSKMSPPGSSNQRAPSMANNDPVDPQHIEKILSDFYNNGDNNSS